MKEKTLDPRAVAAVVGLAVVMVIVAIVLGTRGANNGGPSTPPPRLDGVPSTLKPNQMPSTVSPGGPPVALGGSNPSAGAVVGSSAPPTGGQGMNGGGVQAAAPNSGPASGTVPAPNLAGGISAPPPAASLPPGQAAPVGTPLKPGSVTPQGQVVNQDGTVGADHAAPMSTS